MPQRGRNPPDMKKLKILHSADFHMDSPISALPDGKAALRRAELRQIPAKLADLAIQEKADAVLLSGDLFDSNSIYSETWEELFENLARIPAPVVISPGNHDYYCSASPYAKRELPSNVYVFTGNEISFFDFPDLGLRVYGAAFTSSSCRPMLENFHAERENSRISILCIHGESGSSGARYNPVSEKEIAASGLNYIAFGHVHNASGLLRAGNTFYSQPGCPEGRGFDETGHKTVNILELDGESCALREECIAAREYSCLRADLTDQDPAAALESLIPNDSERMICRMILTGDVEKSPDLPALAARFAGCFFHLEIFDETHLKTDIWEKAGENSLRGVFLLKMKQKYDLALTETEKNQTELAARWGLAALDRREEITIHEYL